MMNGIRCFKKLFCSSRAVLEKGRATMFTIGTEKILFSAGIESASHVPSSRVNPLEKDRIQVWPADESSSLSTVNVR